MSIPMPETADQLGIGTDHLRRLRREHGLPDWRVFANQWAARQCAVLYERYSFSCPVSCPHCPDPEHGKRAP
jgi:hypothetical protein